MFRPILAICLGFLTLSVNAAAAPTVRTVPADAIKAATPHDVIAGRATTLKATLSSSASDVEAVWDFGDGSEAARFAVTNARDVSVRHTYTGDAGTSFTARLKVTNRSTGESAEGVYQVRIAEPTLAVLARIAVDEGLWYLHKSLDAGGSWRGDCAACDASGSVAPANLQAFERAGFEESGDASNPYTETVAAARRWSRVLKSRAKFRRGAQPSTFRWMLLKT